MVSTQADMVRAVIAEAIAKGIPLAELVKGIGAEAKAHKDAEAIAHAAKIAKLASVQALIEEQFTEIVETYATDLEVADGVWYTWDFGKALQGVRLLNAPTAVPKATSAGGNGGGKKYDVSTEALVEKYSTYTFTAEDVGKMEDKSWLGCTVKEVDAAVKGKKNAHHHLRKLLLKMDGRTE